MGARTSASVATWVGLALLLAGLIMGVLPLLPVRAGQGTMHGVPHLPWTSGGIAALGVILLLSARGRNGRGQR